MRIFVLSSTAVVLGALLVGACRDEPTGGTGGGAGGGQGGAGGCPTAPHAAFDVTLTAEDGPLPADTSLEVAWSVGSQTFVLDDPTTWKSLVDGNVVCDVDRDAGPPASAPKLVCALWTTGPTRVTVRAKGYAALEQTLAPKVTDTCDAPLTGAVALVLRRPAPDAGTE